MANESNYHPIGTILADGDVELEIVENNFCDGCYYLGLEEECNHPTYPKCTEEYRPDNKSIIYKETRLQQKQDALESRVAVLEAQINEQNKKIKIVLSQLVESIKTH